MASKIETVQQIYGEFGKGNVPGVLNLLTDDISWNDPGYPAVTYAAKRKGKTEVANFFAEMGKTVSFTRFEPQKFFCDGDMVIVKGFFAGKSNATGKAFESEWVMLWEVVDGKVKSYQAFTDTVNIASALQ